MKFLKALALCAFSLLGLNQAVAEELDLASFSPVVVSSFPTAGDAEVDASITEIKVTFSKDMMTEKMWSVVQLSKDSFPPITGKVRFLADQRTFVIPVKLKPNKVYALGFNSQNQRNFKDKTGKSAQPYLLSFKTN